MLGLEPPQPLGHESSTVTAQLTAQSTGSLIKTLKSIIYWSIMNFVHRYLVQYIYIYIKLQDKAIGYVLCKECLNVKGTSTTSEIEITVERIFFFSR